MGIEIAQAAARLGCATTLLLGPTSLTPTHTEHLTKTDTRVKVRRFRSTADLSQLLNEEFPQCDILIMAAAVADYRPVTTDGSLPDKLPRSAAGMTLRLEPTPDLVAGLARERLPGQVVVGFALEPEAELMERAQRKLARKSLDFIVANPLETMDAEDVSATVYSRAGVVFAAKRPLKKKAFAEKLMKEIYSFARPRT